MDRVIKYGNGTRKLTFEERKELKKKISKIMRRREVNDARLNRNDENWWVKFVHEHSSY